MGAIPLTIVTNDETTEIKSEFISRQRDLESQIARIDNLITDLISHKLSLENANRQIEQMAVNEKDGAKRGKLYFAMRTNIELLTKVFGAISDLENIKFRYNKEIDDVIEKKTRIVFIDIKRLNEKLSDNAGNLSEFFDRLSNAMNSPSNRKAITQDLNSNPDYKL
jgi:hypothetical protein